MVLPLYVKTENTLLSSMITIPKLIKFAKEHQLDSLAICDDTLYGVMEFYNACLKNNIKPIVGLDCKLENDNVLLYAKNYQGYQQLTRISTKISEKCLNIDYLLENCSDLPITIISLYDKLNKHFDQFYIGITDLEEKPNINAKTIYLPIIKALQIEDLNYLPYLEAIKEGKTLEEIKKSNINSAFISYSLNENQEEYIKNTAEIIDNCNLQITFNT